MWETVRKDWTAKVGIVIFLLLTVWWFISPSFTTDGRFFGDYPSIYALMALWGGIWGVSIARQWGGFKSVMGKAILMFSLGLFAQVFGQVAYAYIAFYKNTEVPYPSLGDVGYFGSIPLYIFGVWLLLHMSGAKIRLRTLGNKILLLLIPGLMLILAYYLFLQGYQFDFSNPIKVFLDFGYPFGQAIYISLAILTYLLSKNVLGGMMRPKFLFILFALCIQFLSDYSFLYQTSKGTFAVGGIVDYMYLIAYFLMSMGLIQFKVLIDKLRA